jgi:non-specific serine/threonine protein kinase
MVQERLPDEHAARPIDHHPTPDFVQQVRDSLRSLHDRTRLQTHPLARFASPHADKRVPGRGKRLQEELLQAIEAMRPDSQVPADSAAARSYQLLARRYVDALDTTEVQRQLAIGKTEYYADHQRALDAVASVLWERWQPKTTAEPAPPRASHRSEPASTAVAAPGAALPRADVRRHNLPAELTSFVGRQDELVDVTRLLGAHRLVTLTGTGGCGKTRLALRVASSRAEDFPDGVWHVELAPLADPNLVAPTVAAVLGVQEQPDQPLLATLVETLQAKRLLLVLDNCEHLIEVCAQLTEALLRGCPTLRILATSREALGVAGEVAWRVPSLPIPSQRSLSAEVIDLGALAHFDGIRLFVERARLVDPGYALNELNAPIVAQICRRLDGMPLAIELAAARVKVLAVETIAARLDDQFRLLAGGRRTALPRQQTLRATIDWSYNLLSESERRLFRCLAAFMGGWSLEAAEAVCSRAGIDAREAFDLLTQLVDKSLVQVETHAGKERYRLLETIRQYGRDRLVDAGEAENVRNHHFDWFLELAERVEPELIGPRQVAWLDRLETEQDNFRAALAWGLDSRPAILGLRLASALWRLWHVRDRESEGLDWLRQALAAPGAQTATAARAKALQGVWELTHFAAAASSLEQARAADESLTICQEIGDRVGAAWSMQMMGRQACYQGDYARARVLLEQAYVLAQQEKARWVMAQVLEGLGVLAAAGDDLIVARRHFGESLALFRELGDRRAIGMACGWAGVAAGLLGDYTAARARSDEALRISRDLGSRVRTAYLLMRLGALSNIDGDYEQSRALLAEGQAIARDVGARWLNGLGLVTSGWLARAEGDTNRAMALTIEALTIFHASAVPRGVRLCLGSLGALAVEAGRVRLGAGLLAAASSIGDVDQFWRVHDDPRAYEAAKYAARTALGDREFELAWAEGRAMTLDQVVAYALAESDT